MRTMPLHSPRSAGSWRWPALWLFFCVSFFLWKRLPAPDVDDLFFFGAPLRIVETGELVNPLLRRWEAPFGTNRYFLQMPLHPYLLAGWLRVCGVSTLGILSFHWVCYAAGALGLAAYLRRFGWRLEEVLWLLPIYLVLMLWLGGRPDVAAFALLFAGAGLLIDPRQGHWTRALAAFALMGFSVLCYPMTLVWAAGLTLAEAARSSAAREDQLIWPLLARWLLPLAGATLLVGGVFLGLVQGEVREFLRVFLACRALRAAPALPALWKSLVVVKKELLALPAFVLFPALATVAALGGWGNNWRLPTRTRLLTVSLFLIVMACVATYYALNARVSFLLAFFIAALAAGNGRVWVRSVTYGIFLLATALWWVQTLFLHPPAAPEIAAARQCYDALAAASPGRTVWLDAAAARYFFDYRLPTGALDLFYSAPIPGYATTYPPEANATWVATRPWLRYLREMPRDLVDYPTYRLRGRPLETLPREPYELVVLAGD